MFFAANDPGLFAFAAAEGREVPASSVGEADGAPLLAFAAGSPEGPVTAASTPADLTSEAVLTAAALLPPLPSFGPAGQEIVGSSLHPWSTVVYVEAVFPNGQVFGGSGVIVGRNDVLTAAHVVYNPAAGGLATSVLVVPAFTPDRWPYAPYGASYAAVTAADFSVDPDGDGMALVGNGGPGLVGSEVDVAFLTLNAPLGDRTGWMLLDPTFQRGDANLSGYPGQYGGRLTNDTAYAFDDARDAFTNIAAFEAHKGNSGGPLWVLDNLGRPAVVGLVSSAEDGRGVAAFDIATSYGSIVGWITGNDTLLA